MCEIKGKYFDEATFLKNFQGMEDLAYDMVVIFLGSVDSMVAEVENAIKSNNAGQIEISAHSLKGSVSNFYAQECVQIAFKIEQMACGKSYDNNEMNDCLKILKTTTKNLKKDLVSFQDRKKSA